MGDVSRKLYKEDILLLNQIQTALLRRDMRFSQKELIDKSIKFAAGRERQFLEFVNENPRKDNTKELIERFLRHPKKNFGRNFLEEIDTIM